MSTAVTTGVKPRAFSWSYSQLNNYETCPRRYYEYSVAKSVDEPESEHLKVGHDIHSAFEARVATGEKLPLGMGMHEKLLSSLAGAPGRVYAEQKLAINISFSPVGWFAPGAWFRQVLDYTNVREDGLAVTVDYKTGRPREDDTQLQLAALTLFAHDPSVMRVRTAFVYVNHDHTERRDIERDEAPALWAEILPRVSKLERARMNEDFPPKPGGLCRRYCGVKSCPFWGR